MGALRVPGVTSAMSTLVSSDLPCLAGVGVHCVTQAGFEEVWVRVTMGHSLPLLLYKLLTEPQAAGGKQAVPGVLQRLIYERVLSHCKRSMDK